MSDTERQERIKEIYSYALECTEDERAAFLAEACAGDDELRREVEALLGYQTPTTNLLETPPLRVVTEILAAEQNAALIGQQLGNYRLLERIGAGGMGEVYAAQDVRLGRKVALKLLPTQFTVELDRVRRFEQEARAASALNHPNILTIHEIGEQRGIHFMAMEFVEGETLRQRLTQGKPDLSAALDIALQMAAALAAAHAAGIIHRDIKPENVMLRRDGYIKVLDFGLAKLLEPRESPTDNQIDSQAATNVDLTTEPGLLMGTASYMSPEQARGLKVDARTDIFSLGVVLYEMVAGQRPFAGVNAVETLAAILEREPPPLAAVPRALVASINKALSKDREARYQRITDLLNDLKDFKQELEFQAKLERTARPSDVDTGRRPVGYETVRLEATPTGADKPPPNLASAEHRVGQLERRSALLLLALLLALTAAVYFAATRYFAERRIDSIAVLPFSNASNNPDAEYLSDGISEGLINRLSRLPGVKVIARTSSFRYKGKEIDPQEVAQALGVKAVLTGRVSERGNRLLISAELMDARDKTQIWGEQYDRPATDLLAVQTAISTEIAERLRLKLTESAAQQLTKHETAQPQAYELLLKGRYYWNQRTPDSLRKSIDYFQQAIAQDARYAAAYAGLADSYTLLGIQEVMLPKQAFEQGRAAAAKALELDPLLAEAHTSLAHLSLHSWNLQAADREFKRALELNPHYANLHHWQAEYFTALQRSAEAVAAERRSLELDPLSLVINTDLGWHLYFGRQYDQAIAQYRRALELDRNFPLAHLRLGQVYAQKGNYQEAIAELNQAVTLSGGSTEAISARGYACALAGQREQALQALAQLQERAKQGYVSAYFIARIHLGLGDKEQTFNWLEKAYADGSGWLVFIRAEPQLAGLQADPRFADLLRRVGLAQ
jgi:eukaryotic-like serine/threonine-protein kinase